MKVVLRWSLAFALQLLVLMASAADLDTRTVTLLFTNDLESAYDPTPAFWRDDMDNIGGIAQLATLIEQKRSTEANVFLFDSGDIFTGTLARLTRGEVSFELMMTMAYDAMAVGNHEFEYGWQAFAEQKDRAPFPVLAANLFYKGTDHPYAQPYAIIERGDVRIGVVGILGQDAATALIPAHIEGVDVRDPATVIAPIIRQLKPEVDLVVLLTHQGKTAPMQTDDEGRPDVQRDIDVDIALAGKVPGIDVLFGGHADAGTRAPVVHPDTGTLIMQTYGQGQHLGFLQLRLEQGSAKIVSFEGRLIEVNSDTLVPDARVAAKLAAYRKRFPEIYARAGFSQVRLNRQYNLESDLGNLFADIARDQAGAQVGLIPSGALRKDIPAGMVRRVDLLDAFPFTDQLVVMEMSGAVLQKVVEQGLSLQRGILQVSGLQVTYDLQKPIHQRSTGIQVNGEPLSAEAIYRVATLEILAAGGDAYVQAREGHILSASEQPFSEMLERYFQANVIVMPERGRLLPSVKN